MLVPVTAAQSKRHNNYIHVHTR